jgi:hypothetical protein
MNYINDGEHIFELVDHVPLGYSIWNIGKNMPDGYLPFCRIIPGTDNIEPDTLKAIKLDDAQIILSAIGGGVNTIKKMERYLKRYEYSRHGTYAYHQVQKIKLALPLMRSFKWS